MHSSLARARETSGELAQEAARASGASASAERALSELSDRMKEATGSDPETSKALAEASEHARALVAALGALRDKAPSAVVAAVLRPVLEPLVRLLDGDDAEPSSREPSGSRGPSGRREG